jgi:hypothetical protein
MTTTTPGRITADASAAQAKKNGPYFRKLLAGMRMTGGMGSVREADYKGHHITVTTVYRVKIDGKPFNAILGVSNSGLVHYHGMPNAGFASAIDLVKSVIDTFPDEFPARSQTGSGAMDGMTMTKKDVRSKAAVKKPVRRK